MEIMRVTKGANWFAPSRFRGDCRRKQKKGDGRTSYSIAIASDNSPLHSQSCAEGFAKDVMGPNSQGRMGHPFLWKVRPGQKLAV